MNNTNMMVFVGLLMCWGAIRFVAFVITFIKARRENAAFFREVQVRDHFHRDASDE